MQPIMTLEEVEALILERLPGILERDPRFVTFIEGIVAEKFPRRDEFARLLDEVQQHRAETAQQTQRVEQRVEQVGQHVERVDQRVERVEQRVEQVGQHVERVDQRVEQVGQHVERVDQRVEHIDQRVERIDQQLQEHRTETAEQFKRVDQRFEQVDQRFEQVDQRFEQVDQRFEQVDQRFEQVDQRFEQVDQRFVELTQRMEDGFRNVQISIDRLGARWGIRNEALFRQTMREVLEKSYGAKVEERVIEGEQFDCIIIDNAHILIEISASVGKDILKKLQRKRQLYTDQAGIAPSRFLLVVGSIYSHRANALRDAGFEVIEPEIDESM